MANKEIMRAAFMEVVDNQIAANDPPETKQTLNRLISEGWSDEDAKALLAQCVIVEVFRAGKYGEQFNQGRFLYNLKNLPDEPVEVIRG